MIKMFTMLFILMMSVACATTQSSAAQQSTAKISTEYNGPAKCELTPEQKEKVAREVAEFNTGCLQLVDDPLNNNCPEAVARYERTAIEVYTSGGCQ